MGKENAFLLGSLLVSKFQQTAMSRQAQQVAARRDFWLYIDEFHNFITPSMAEILSGARKYRLGLILAHQELRQLERDREVASAVLSNPYTRIVFRVGDADARQLENGFSFFEARDLQNLETGQAVCRIEKAGQDFNLTVPFANEAEPDGAQTTRQAVIAASRATYATPRAEVEAMLLAKFNEEDEPTKAQRSTVSGKEQSAVAPVEAKAVAPVVEEVKAPVVREPAPPRDLGRGGEQHKAIQERIQSEAHALGFLAEVERQLADTSMQAADVILSKDGLVIAVEISITTTTDHEFKNVKKCLEAGFSRVAVISPRASQLQNISEAVLAGLGPEASAKVTYHTPDDFIAELRKLVQEAKKSDEPTTPQERTTRGYKVKRHGPALTPDERQVKENSAHKIMAESMKHKR